MPTTLAKVGLVLLAAGGSVRMQRPKQLLLWQGRSLIRHLAEVALGSDCDPIVVVLGAWINQILPQIQELPLQIVENPDWQSGQSTSLRAGIAQLLTTNCTATIVLLGDQPLVTVAHLNQLVAVHQTSGRRVVASVYADSETNREVFGVPALFHRSLFANLQAIRGDRGARQVIAAFRQQAGEVATVDFPAGAIDLDTPTDYQHVYAAWGM